MLEEKLRLMRSLRGMSQTTVAKKLKISRTTYNAYENGRREPDLLMLCLLADFYGVTTDYLLGREIECPFNYY